MIAPSEAFAVMDAIESLFNPTPIIGPPPSTNATPNSGEDWIGCLYDPSPVELGPNFESFVRTKIPAQHGTYFNEVCCDGHVVAVPISTLFAPAKSAQNWNVDHQPHAELW